MPIADLLSPANVFVDLRVTNKEQLLRELGERVAMTADLAPEMLVHEILAREALGSTGVGAGVALPHARVEKLSKPVGAFARLKRSIEFEAIDGRLVDLVFLLALPASDDKDGFNALASVARVLREPSCQAELRALAGSLGIHQRLTRPS
jgi:PTS system nitrogen regulatory IIA component